MASAGPSLTTDVAWQLGVTSEQVQHWQGPNHLQKTHHISRQNGTYLLALSQAFELLGGQRAEASDGSSPRHAVTELELPEQIQCL